MGVPALRDYVAIGLGLLGGTACDVLGPTCLARQQRGPVAVLNGEIVPGQVAMHRVSYGTDGSQNDARVSWTGQGAPDGPSITVHATGMACADFSPPGLGACLPIGSRGGYASPTARPCVHQGACSPEPGEIVQTSLTIVSGRGNPDILGAPAEYKLWVVGDPERRATYTIDITWFYGPDC
jgi:hypothetical protein